MLNLLKLGYAVLNHVEDLQQRFSGRPITSIVMMMALLTDLTEQDGYGYWEDLDCSLALEIKTNASNQLHIMGKFHEKTDRGKK